MKFKMTNAKNSQYVDKIKSLLYNELRMQIEQGKSSAKLRITNDRDYWVDFEAYVIVTNARGEHYYMCYGSYDKVFEVLSLNVQQYAKQLAWMF